MEGEEVDILRSKPVEEKNEMMMVDIAEITEREVLTLKTVEMRGGKKVIERDLQVMNIVGKNWGRRLILKGGT